MPNETDGTGTEYPPCHPRESRFVVTSEQALATTWGITLTDLPAFAVHTITSGTEAEAVAHLQARGALVQARAPLLRMSSLHDLEHRRPLEIEETLGYVVTQAVTMGLTVPTVGHVLPPHAWPQSMHAAREWVTMLALWSRGNLSLSAVY